MKALILLALIGAIYGYQITLYVQSEQHAVYTNTTLIRHPAFDIQLEQYEPCQFRGQIISHLLKDVIKPVPGLPACVTFPVLRVPVHSSRVCLKVTECSIASESASQDLHLHVQQQALT